jgi:hypothetical protein
LVGIAISEGGDGIIAQNVREMLILLLDLDAAATVGFALGAMYCLAVGILLLPLIST